MKEENKYYIPEIEEFHVGFEYEKDFKEEVYEIDDDENTLCAIHEGRIRVKYLDKDDIENLGWKYFGYNKLTDLIEFRLNQFISSVGESSNTLSVYRKLWIQTKDKPEGFYSEDHLYKIFEGTIKNKSEFKTLMKWLNIN